ncbi:MAG: transposase [Verrucomicrobiae bacterium]|nr:transposase [Verrucomicrobiae bacterium]
MSTLFPEYDPPLYFVTICSFRRKALFHNPSFHVAFRAFCQEGHRAKGIAVGRYVIMPDHIHLFLLLPSDVRLTQWERMLKLVLGRHLRQLGPPPPYWQRGFFDHVIRHAESYAAKWQYVHDNPVRAGLVACAADWPFQGELIFIDHA